MPTQLKPIDQLTIDDLYDPSETQPKPIDQLTIDDLYDPSESAAPAALQVEPPTSPDAGLNRQLDVMAAAGRARPAWPKPEDLPALRGIGKQTAIGGLGIYPEAAKSANNALRFLSAMAGEAIGSQYGAIGPRIIPGLEKSWRGFWKGMEENFKESADYWRDYTEAVETIGEATEGPREVRQLTTMAGSLMPSLAAAPVGFPAMVAAAGLQQAGDTFDQVLQKRIDAGEDPATARSKSMLDGMISGFITGVATASFGRTGVDALSKVMGNAGAKRGLASILKEAGLEGAEELTDQVLQSAYERLSYNKDLTLPEAIKESVMALAGGAILGGAVNVASEASASLQEKAAALADTRAIETVSRQLVASGVTPQTRRVTTRGAEGAPVTVDVQVQPSPVPGPPEGIMPPVAGVEGARVVNQALSVGLPQTAQELIAIGLAEQGANLAPQISLTPPREVGIPPAAPTSPIQATARQVAETILPPSQPESAPSPPGAPLQSVPQTVQQAPAVRAAEPGRAQGAPGAVPATQQAVGLQTNLRQFFPQLTSLEVVNTAEQLPEAVKSDLRGRGLELGDVDAVFHNGRVIFNAEKFPVGDPDLVRRKVTHEVAIHLGLRQALGRERFGNLVQEVWEGLNPNRRAEIAARNRLQPGDRGTIAEEWLAYEAERVIQEGKSNPVWSQIADLVRKALRKFGLGIKYSDTEIANLIAKGMRAAEGQPAAGSRTEYPPGSPLATVDTIRYSYADITKARLDGLREYSPEIVNAGIEGAFKGVQQMLTIEAASLSDLIPPTTPWHQPADGSSLLEYVRRFYSPEGIALLRTTFAGNKPPDFVQDKAAWHRIKTELLEVGRLEGGPPGLGASFLAMNRKAGGFSWDFGLGTCMPTENCSVCYAKGISNPLLGTQARMRHSIVTALEPEAVGTMIARYVTTQKKENFPFLRVNGSGDTTFPWQATAVNTLILNMDRPVHIFSRSHVSRAPGTIGLDSIINGWYSPGDVANGVAVFKMGSIDRQLVTEYGIPFLKENLARRGIINSYLVKDAQDIPTLLRLKEAGVFMVLHINRTNETVQALREAGLIANDQNPELNTPSCYCALESGPFFNGCATCLVGGGPCFAMGSMLGMTPEGQVVLLEELLSGEVIPPDNQIVEMSRIGQLPDKAKMLANVAAKSYEVAATDLEGKIQNWESGKKKTVIVQNPRDRTGILRATNQRQVDQAKQIVEDWRAYAKWLRGLVDRFENSAGFYRYVAQADLEEALSLDEAMTEGIGAAARAVEQPNALFSITQGVPLLAHDVAKMTPSEFAEAARGMEGGLTGTAVKVGDQVKTEEGVAKLREYHAAAQADYENFKRAGNFGDAMFAATKAQFFREAMEAATNTGSMRTARETGIIAKADVTPATQPEVPLPNIAAEGPPPSLGPMAPLLPPQSDQKIPDHDDDYLTRFSISQLPDPNLPGMPIRNESMEQALRELGLPGLTEAIGKPDAQLMADVQAKMARFPHWVDTILQREMKKPGLLTDEEVMALDLWMLQLRTEIHSNARKAEQAEAAGLPAEASGYRANVDFWTKALERLGDVTKRSGTESARAFRARQLAARWDFTLETLIHSKRQAKGWKPLTADERADLEKKARDYQERTVQLEAELAKLRGKEVDTAIDEQRRELERINPQVLDFAKEWVATYTRKAKTAKERLLEKWSREFPSTPLRASVTGPPPLLPESLMVEVAIIGGAKLAQNITDQAAWEAAMVEELGPNIQPYLAAARQAADAHFAAELAAGRAEARARRAPRRVPGQAPVAPAEPTIGERIDVTKKKIHQVAERIKTTTEPMRARRDEIFYPVQRLVRELVEQDPLIPRQELINQVHQVLVQEWPNWTEAETMDAISGRGRVRYPDPETVAKTIRDLKAQIRILAHIADTEAELPLPKTGYQQDKPSDEQRRLLERLAEAKRVHGEVVTDPEAQLASYLQSRKTWYRNRISDLEWEISNRELISRKTRKPLEEDAELKALQEEYDRLRAEHQEIFVKPELSDQQRLEMAEKAAERIILKMEEDLAAGRRTFARKRDPVASAQLEALRTRIVQLKAEQEWAQMALNPQPQLTDPADIRRWFALDKQIRKIQLQLANKDVFTPKKTIRPESAANQKLVEELEDLKRQRQEMREQLKPTKIDPVTRAINMRIAQLQRQIADYQQRIADRDFGPRKPKEPPKEVRTNPEVIRLLAERERIKKDFWNELDKDRWAAMGTVRKIASGINRTRTAITNLRSSFDFSAMRQGLPALLSLASRVPTSPIKVPARIAKAFGQMFQAAYSTKKSDQISEAIKQKPNYESGAYKIMGIQFTELDADQLSFSKWEENARSVFDQWARQPIWNRAAPIRSLAAAPFRLVARPVAASNRAFATFLNVLRSELADQLLDINFKDRPPTENELRVLGNYVNVATGRGHVSPRYAQGFSQVLWAPKLLMSRVQFLTGQPLWGGGNLKNSGRARRIIAMEYARVLGSAFLLYLFSRLFDEKKETNPTSSDFGKIVRGNTRIDIWGGFQQMVTFLSRMATGKTTTLRGREIDLLAANRYGQGGLNMVLVRFLRSKLRPDVGVALDLATRQNFLGQPVTVPGVLEDLFVPLPFTDIRAILKDRGFTEGMILELLNQFGAGVNTYEDVGPNTFLGNETRTR